MQNQIQATPPAQRKSGTVTCAVEAKAPKKQAASQGQVQAQVSDPVDTNSTCNYARNNFNGKYWYTRQDTCYIASNGVRKIDPRTGAVLGGIDFEIDLLNYVASGVTWGGQLKLIVNRVDPIMAGTTLAMTPTCAGSCSASGGFSPQNISYVGNIIRANPAYTMTGFTNSMGFGTTAWTGTFYFTNTNPPTLSANYLEGKAIPQARCDQGGRGVAGSGCVYPAYTPTLTYSRAIVGPLAQHIADAQASGLPGAPGGTPLNRLNSSIDDSNDNRDTACPASFPRPQDANGVTLDCDEYPFASSKQGASTSGVNGGGRTFDYCQIAPRLPIGVTGNGYSACMIDRSANRSGGGSLNAFYRSQRVLWDDAFRVSITA